MIVDPYKMSPGGRWHAASAHSAIIIDGPAIRQTQRLGIIYCSARLATAYSGKCYHSFRVNYRASGGILGVGTVNGTQALTSDAFWLGSTNTSGAAWGPDDNSYVNGASVGPGFDEDYVTPIDVEYDIAVDTSTRRVWIRKTGGSWIGGGNPASGTTPTYTSPSSSSGLYFAGCFTAGDVPGTEYEITALLGDAALGTPPSGYSVWG